MKFLKDQIVTDLKNSFKKLNKPVVISFFTQEMECRFCQETKQLLSEVAEISDKIHLKIFDFVADKNEADRLGIDKIPAIAVQSEQHDYGIRIYGIPGGYEFTSLVELIQMVSTGESSLSRETKRYLDQLQTDIHLQVFVTPTCPYCPGAVILSQQLAFYSPKVRADMIEATEFPHLAHKYNVMGVPRTIINEREFVEGSIPEEMLLTKIKEFLATP
jgi:glutaredoxin-like protein